MITEADARVLPEGSHVELLPRGHITPLAADTLRDRRITVVRLDGLADPDDLALAPVADVRAVMVGADHTGVALRDHLVSFLRRTGRRADQVGPSAPTPAPADYPDIAEQVAMAVARGQADAGIVIDGAGLGSAMAANKVRGIRAALCLTPTLARYARQHNGAHVLSLGASLLSAPDAEAIVVAFLDTPMTEPRYLRRLVKLDQLERRQACP